MPFEEVDEIIARANDTEYGLAAGVWTKDVSKAHYVASKLKAGTVWVNCFNGKPPSSHSLLCVLTLCCAIVYDSAKPFGGFKQSGLGRELGSEGLDNYLETKTVTVSLA